MKPSRVILLIISFAAVAAGVYLFMNGARFMGASARRSLMSGIHVGMTRTQVIAVKGEPYHVARSLKDMRTVNYYPEPSISVEKEVLEYNKFVWRMFVYIGRDDRVTAIHLART